MGQLSPPTLSYCQPLESLQAKRSAQQPGGYVYQTLQWSQTGITANVKKRLILSHDCCPLHFRQSRHGWLWGNEAALTTHIASLLSFHSRKHVSGHTITNEPQCLASLPFSTDIRLNIYWAQREEENSGLGIISTRFYWLLIESRVLPTSAEPGSHVKQTLWRKWIVNRSVQQQR